ncbi:type I methionyl aminopeptidase [Candidatus Saccharibacteria bacterium RIFCSPHIGHO2_01_FULL_45_15]|nr:MAG: type I methionyl aminopeptidase [Candidatus Saccharibacteria bacterium RIFCSPHIGHO2_01_FULL_45_15]OGL27683.1 MAG: type I methionyl aminopeptidase [Candidatus Saccharibacteria bacterium RIFCSPHIGHO2_02_FULL_46_12]OGL32063.1 MAG: type I methionyl aminopeptidase [Candidatus Saccharibacteria bacterium RIFCSPHIGHO2_12_FULL_44_22]
MSQPEKTTTQIQAMREGGRILATIFDGIKKRVKVGMTELEVDLWVEKEIKRLGATPTYKEPVPDFPNVICISTNEEIVHSIPTDYTFEAGDIVSFDLVISYKGMKTDSAFTMIVGEKPSGAKKHLVNLTERSLYAGIDAIKGRGTYTGDIGAAIEKVLSDGKLGIIRDLVGHGIGPEMHMEPDVPNYGRKGSGVLLRPGDTIAIEPMATLGGEKILTDKNDGWTIYTKDKSLAAHFEHTVLITEDGAEILTQL